VDGGDGMTRLAPIDLAVLGVYAVGIFSLAQVVSRRKGGETQGSADYFLASRSLPWWAIGASLIAANISAEQIVGMSGSGFAIGLAISSYEWMAALTLLIVGKYFLPIFLDNKIYTMPQFLEYRYGTRIRTLMAVFWLGLYVFVNLTSIIWLGSIAVNQVSGMNQELALALLGGFALLYQFWGGLKAVALTDIVQVTLLFAGGVVISALTLGKIGEGRGIVAGFQILAARAPDHFHMILARDNPYYKDLPGISVLVGGLWVMNLSYWGFNQYIIQRALAAKSLAEAQRGVVFAAYLKLLMPFIIVLPGITAVLLAPGLERPDQAYPTVMALLPPGLLGLVFAALVAAIVASTASKINSIATIFTLDIWNSGVRRHSERQLVRVGRIAAVTAILIAIVTARPLLGSFDQAFQYIQEYTGFFTPGIVVIFLLGLFWKRATETAALSAAVGSFVLSLALKLGVPALPFMDRVGAVFVAAFILACAVSLAKPAGESGNRIETATVDYSTSRGFAVGSAGVVMILAALYATWW
jgi:SSS family solute:Na+ symporter